MKSLTSSIRNSTEIQFRLNNGGFSLAITSVYHHPARLGASSRSDIPYNFMKFPAQCLIVDAAPHVLRIQIHTKYLRYSETKCLYLLDETSDLSLARAASSEWREKWFLPIIPSSAKLNKKLSRWVSESPDAAKDSQTEWILNYYLLCVTKRIQEVWEECSFVKQERIAVHLFCLMKPHE